MTNTELKRIRNELRLTAPEMAAALGVPLRTYYDREAGNVPIKPESAKLVRFVVREMAFKTGRPF